jgi:hypothetical protein
MKTQTVANAAFPGAVLNPIPCRRARCGARRKVRALVSGAPAFLIRPDGEPRGFTGFAARANLSHH